jgi:CRP/FNR family transcriptional regulator, cyclic AMP receptor protein
MILNYQRSLIEEIQNIPWFNELTPAQVEQLAAISRIAEFHPEEIVFHEGDRTDFMYVVLSGQILAENYIPSLGDQGVLHAEPLDVIGWSCLTPMVRQRIATARACQPSRLLAIEGEALASLCDSDRDLGYVIMRRVANIVASQFLATRLYLYDIIQNFAPAVDRSNPSRR